MDIEKARHLKVGDHVKVPDDRGTPGGIAVVERVFAGEPYKTAIDRTKYIWVLVRRNDRFAKHTSTWPSNRIQKI